MFTAIGVSGAAVAGMYNPFENTKTNIIVLGGQSVGDRPAAGEVSHAGEVVVSYDSTVGAEAWYIQGYGSTETAGGSDYVNAGLLLEAHR
jgi:hypothetical protein